MAKKTSTAPKVTKTKTAKTSKPKTTTAKTKKSSVKSDTTAKSNKNLIAYIVGAVACIALLVIGIIALADSIGTNGKNSLTVKTGDGEKIATQYLGFDDFNFRLKVPTSFRSLTQKEIEKKYGKDNMPDTVYANDTNSANITITPTDNTMGNDQIKTYLETTKSVFKLGGNIIADDYYTQGNHNVATIQMITDGTDDKYYNYMLFFSQNDKLTMVTFTCKNSERNKWEPVAKFIIQSIDFIK